MRRKKAGGRQLLIGRVRFRHGAVLTFLAQDYDVNRRGARGCLTRAFYTIGSCENDGLNRIGRVDSFLDTYRQEQRCYYQPKKRTSTARSAVVQAGDPPRRRPSFTSLQLPLRRLQHRSQDFHNDCAAAGCQYLTFVDDADAIEAEANI